jgi:hypothetical protein
MAEFDITYLLYFLFAGLSILGVAVSGYQISKRTNKQRPFVLPQPKLLYLLGIWIFFYFLSLTVEILGHYIGFWTWLRDFHVFLHAAFWWANILTTGVWFLSSLNPHLRYLILLGWVLLFELIQEASIHWVTHFPLLGNPYLMIIFVMCVVCLTSYLALDLLKKLKLLKNKD